MKGKEMVDCVRILFALFFLSVIAPAANLSECINLNQLSSEAEKEHKYIFLFFQKEGCGYCERMIEESLGSVDIKSKLKKDFMSVRVNIDTQGAVQYRDFNGTKHAFAKFLQIGLYPSIAFLDENNNIIYGVIGYRRADQLSRVLDYVSSGNYKEIDFESFENGLDFEGDD